MFGYGPAGHVADYVPAVVQPLGRLPIRPIFDGEVFFRRIGNEEMRPNEIDLFQLFEQPNRKADAGKMQDVPLADPHAQPIDPDVVLHDA